MDVSKILFKGFHQCDEGEDTIYIADQKIKGFWVQGDFAQPNNIVFCKDDVWDDYSIIPITLCAYTGMNAGETPIFQDDVLQWQSEDGTEHDVVTFHHGAWCVSKEPEEVFLLHDFISFCDVKNLGNVFSIPPKDAGDIL